MITRRPRTRRPGEPVRLVTGVAGPAAPSGPATPPRLSGARRVVAVASGKGGVGKSTVAVNLALGLAHLGPRVGLLDADVPDPNVPPLLGVRRRADAADWPAPVPLVVAGETEPRERLPALDRYGLMVMSVRLLVGEDRLADNAPPVGQPVRNLLPLVDRGDPDRNGTPRPTRPWRRSGGSSGPAPSRRTPTPAARYDGPRRPSGDGQNASDRDRPMRLTPPPASLLVALLLGSPTVGSVAPGATAQTGTPSAGLPAAPDPAECTVPPRSLASVEAALGPAPAAAPRPAPKPDAPAPEPPPDAAPVEPDAAPDAEPEGEPAPLDPELGGPPPVPIGIELPAGEPVDAATTAAITATLRLFVACANAADVARMYALVTDEFLRRSVGNLPLNAAVTDYLAATPTPRPPASRTTLVAVREVRLLADGRVGALVDDQDPTDPRGASLTTDFATFVEQDGRYLLDTYLSGIEAVYGPVATPAP